MNVFSEKSAKVLAWSGLLLIVVSIFVFICFSGWSFSWIINEEKIGQYGDFIGGVVGSLFAFVGIILYYIALTEQRKDIEINRKALETQIETLNQQICEFKTQTIEMQETRTVYVEQTNLYREQTNYYQQQVKELKDQTKISSLQHFNSEFYSLLGVFINIRNDCKESFNNVIQNLKEIVNSNKDTVYNKHSILVEEYTKLYYLNSCSISIYFKTLYRLLKMIKDSNIESEHKQRYAKTLRSQLTDNELLVLYYNYCSDLGEKVKLLVSEYVLLKHLNFMDKIEIDVQIFENYKVPILSYLNKMSILLDSKIEQALDLENENDIDISEELPFIGLPSKYNLQINDNCLILGIEFQNSISLFSKENLKNLFIMYLYDHFILSKLKCTKKEIFESQIIEHIETFELQYKSELTNII